MSGGIFSVRHHRFRADFARLPDWHVHCHVQTPLVLATNSECICWQTNNPKCHHFRSAIKTSPKKMFMELTDVIYHRYRPAASDAYDCVFHHSRQTGMVLPLNRIDLSNSLND